MQLLSSIKNLQVNFTFIFFRTLIIVKYKKVRFTCLPGSHFGRAVSKSNRKLVRVKGFFQSISFSNKISMAKYHEGQKFVHAKKKSIHGILTWINFLVVILGIKACEYSRLRNKHTPLINVPTGKTEIDKCTPWNKHNSIT